MSIRPLLNQLKESGIRIEIKDSKRANVQV